MTPYPWCGLMNKQLDTIIMDVAPRRGLHLRRDSVAPIFRGIKYLLFEKSLRARRHTSGSTLSFLWGFNRFNNITAIFPEKFTMILDKHEYKSLSRDRLIEHVAWNGIYTLLHPWLVECTRWSLFEEVFRSSRNEFWLQEIKDRWQTDRRMIMYSCRGTIIKKTLKRRYKIKFLLPNYYYKSERKSVCFSDSFSRLNLKFTQMESRATVILSRDRKDVSFDKENNWNLIFKI